MAAGGGGAAGDLARPGRMRRSRLDGPIRFRTSFRNTIYDVMRFRGWKETDSDVDWDFHWADRDWIYDIFDNMHLDMWQRVNHYRNGRELCRKDLLAKNVKRMRRQLEKDGKAEEAALYDIIPVTYVLPGDYSIFVEEFKRSAASNVLWIMKPVGKAQGKGIFLFNKLSQISQWKSEHRWKPDNPGVEAYVVQRYIERPYLIGGKKFDLRLYVLVTSFSPLQAWFYRSGFARFSATRYSCDPADIVNTFVHLTNVAIQKTSEDYNPDTGGKWEVRRLKLYLISRVGRERTDQVFRDIQNMCLRALLAVQKVMIGDKHCFEMYGYDIMLDADLRPWLLEVNASPSLTANTKDDYDLKFKLLSDMLDIVDVEGLRSGTETNMGGFDLVYDGDFVATTAPGDYGSLIGADFDRRVTPPKAASSSSATASVAASAAAAAPPPTGPTLSPPPTAAAPLPASAFAAGTISLEPPASPRRK